MKKYLQRFEQNLSGQPVNFACKNIIKLLVQRSGINKKLFENVYLLPTVFQVLLSDATDFIPGDIFEFSDALYFFDGFYSLKLASLSPAVKKNINEIVDNIIAYAIKDPKRTRDLLVRIDSLQLHIYSSLVGPDVCESPEDHFFWLFQGNDRLKTLHNSFNPYLRLALYLAMIGLCIAGVTATLLTVGFAPVVLTFLPAILNAVVLFSILTSQGLFAIYFLRESIPLVIFDIPAKQILQEMQNKVVARDQQLLLQTKTNDHAQLTQEPFNNASMTLHELPSAGDVEYLTVAPAP